MSMSECMYVCMYAFIIIINEKYVEKLRWTVTMHGQNFSLKIYQFRLCTYK